MEFSSSTTPSTHSDSFWCTHPFPACDARLFSGLQLFPETNSGTQVEEIETGAPYWLKSPAHLQPVPRISRAIR